MVLTGNQEKKKRKSPPKFSAPTFSRLRNTWRRLTRLASRPLGFSPSPPSAPPPASPRPLAPSPRPLRRHLRRPAPPNSLWLPPSPASGRRRRRCCRCCCCWGCWRRPEDRAAAAAAAERAAAGAERDEGARGNERGASGARPAPPALPLAGAAAAARAPSRRRRLPARPPDKAREPAPRAMSSSAGSGHQPSQSRAIPTRTVPISDAAQLPHDYCTTPGGTLFSTTPGGERRPPRRGPELVARFLRRVPACLPPRAFNSGRVQAGPPRPAQLRRSPPAPSSARAPGRLLSEP